MNTESSGEVHSQPPAAAAGGGWAGQWWRNGEREGEGSDWRFARRVVIAIALVGLAYFLWSIRRVVLLVFAAVLVSLLLRALADLIARRTPVPKRWSLWASVLVVALLIVGSVALFGAQITGQVRSVVERLPEALDQLGSRLGIQNATGVVENVVEPGAGGNVVSRIAGVGFTILGAIGDLLLVVVAAIYLAADPRLYATGAVKLVPPTQHERLLEALDATALSLRRWFRGQAAAMAAVGTLSGLAFWMIGLPSPLALGIIAGIADFVPFIGPVVGALPAVIFAFGVGGEAVLWTIVAVLAIQQLEGNVIMPLVQRKVVSLPPALALFAILVFGLLFGFLGVFLAVPLTVALMVLVKKLWIRDTLGEDTQLPGEEPAHQPPAHRGTEQA